MQSNTDIFNLSDLQDIPNSLKKETKSINKNKDLKQILELFEIKRTLSLDEIIVGLFRKFGVEKKRAWVMAAMYRASKTGIVTSVKGKKGVYIKNHD